ncbi:MAG: hypothetical protein ACOVP1_12095 [Bacteroidia bacterium]
MQITKENYELFIIDYLDGKLDSNGKQALIAFVEANPEVKEEFDLLLSASSIELEEETSIPDFTYLKKDSLLGNEFLADECMIAALEGDLSPAQSEEFNIILSNDLSKQKEFKLYHATVSKPDLRIQFPNREKLKKAGVILYLNTFYKVASVAAILLFVSFIGWLSLFNSNTIQTANKASNTQLQIASKIEIKPNSTASESKLDNTLNTKESELISKKSVEVNQAKVMLVASQELDFIQSKKASINPVKIIFGGEPQLVIPVFQTNTALADIGTPIDEFKTPAKWLIEKAKMMKPVQPILKTDSLIRNNEVGSVAMNLLNQTPGVVATTKTDDEGNQRGFAIMSRYFSIERSY